MNELFRFDVAPRHQLFHGVHHFRGSWSLRVFSIITGDERFSDWEAARACLADMLEAITERLSPEFEYGRFGSAIIHKGRRGICVTVIHFGSWGTTFEVFSSAWYRYGHSFTGFDLLDDVEPAMCWFEVPLTYEEIYIAYELARDHDLEQIRAKFLTRVPQ
jgi:hypothetical protein